MIDLNEVRNYNKMIDILQKELKQKRKEIGAINVTYNEIRANIINSLAEDTALKIVELEEDIQSYKIKRDKAIVEVKEIINKLDDDVLRKLMELRYIECLKGKDIEKILGYSRQHIDRLHKKALKYISK